nr:mitofilin family membrane protein [Microvirga zambiensis]
MADRVVTVRPVNEPGSTGTPALVARIRQALERGDVAEAATAWEALPEPSRRLSEDWGRQVKAVAQAQQAAQAVSTDALATLNRTTQ